MLNTLMIPKGTAVPLYDLSYIKLHRKLMGSAVYRSAPVVRELFIWLLMNVGWRTRQNEDDKYIGANRGEWQGTINEISKGLSWKSGFRNETYSRSQIQRALAKLVDLGMVETMGAPSGMSVKVCNYETYQGGRTDGRTVSRQQASNNRTIEHNLKDISYNKIDLKERKEIEEVDAYTTVGTSNSAKILRLVKPVFGDLVEPLAGLGGLSKWGHVAAGAIQTYTLESVTAACELLVELHAAGETEVHNPEVFFKKGIPGYIVKAKNRETEVKKKIEKRKWIGYCVECDHQKEFPEKPNRYEECDNCGDQSFYVNDFEYRHEKAARNPQPPAKPVDNFADVREDEDFKTVQNFIKGFGGKL